MQHTGVSFTLTGSAVSGHQPRVRQPFDAGHLARRCLRAGDGARRDTTSCFGAAANRGQHSPLPPFLRRLSQLPPAVPVPSVRLARHQLVASPRLAFGRLAFRRRRSQLSFHRRCRGSCRVLRVALRLRAHLSPALLLWPPNAPVPPERKARGPLRRSKSGGAWS